MWSQAGSSDFVEEHRVKRVPLVVERHCMAELLDDCPAACGRVIDSGHTHWSQPRVISSIGKP